MGEWVKKQKEIIVAIFKLQEEKTKQIAKEEIKRVKESLRTSIAMETKKVFDQHFAQTLEEQKNKIKSFQENFTFLNQNVVQLVENRKTVEDQISKLARSFDRTQQKLASLRAATATQSHETHSECGGDCVGTSPNPEKRFEGKVFE